MPRKQPTEEEENNESNSDEEKEEGEEAEKEEKKPRSEEEKQLRKRARDSRFFFAGAHDKLKKVEQYLEMLLERLTDVLLTQKPSDTSEEKAALLRTKIFSAGVEHDQLGELSKKTHKAYHLLCTPAKEEEDVEGLFATQPASEKN